DDLSVLLDRALAAAIPSASVEAAARDAPIGYADGDGRRLINMVEQLGVAAGEASRTMIDLAFIEATIARSLRRFDKGGDAFYDQISALHKAVRGSDPDASLYWMCRMLDGGVDPLYVGRRMIRMATEDIGLADSRTLGGVARTRSQRAEAGGRGSEELTPTTMSCAAEERKPSARLPPCSISTCCGTIFMPLPQGLPNAASRSTSRGSKCSRPSA